MAKKTYIFSRVDFEYAEEQIARPEVEKQPILPLYEAIYNAIQSSLESHNDEIVIDIEIIRDESALLKEVSRIIEIRVTDYGIGFNDEKTNAFYKLFTKNKKVAFNSKGVGRLTYFSSFKNVEIKSNYEYGGTIFKRDFSVNISSLGTGNIPEQIETDEQIKRTTVRLFNLKPEMQSKYFISFEKIKSDIEDQFAPEILTAKKLDINIVDGAKHDSINKEKFLHSEQSSFSLCGSSFTIYYLKDTRKFAQNNEIWLAAAYRIVKRKPLSFLSASKLHISGEPNFYLKAVVISEFLDNRVNSMRTDFSGIPDKSLYPDQISYEMLYDEINMNARRYVIDIIPNIESSNREIARKIIDKLPHLAFIMDNEKVNNSIPLQSSADKIQSAYVEEFAKEQVEAINYIQKISRDYENNGIPNFETFLKEESKKIEEGSKLNHAYLATYVQYREFIINLFSKFIEPNSKDRCQAESVIHNLLFPMRVISDNHEADYNNHNLWLIDDRYSYYSYLASDIFENKILGRKFQRGDKRYDLYEVFNEGKPTQNVFIIELKKNDAELSQENDPVRQIIDYSLRIKKGEVKDHKGCDINLLPSTCFQGLVLCNTNNSYFKNTMVDIHSLNLRPDGLSYYGIALKNKLFIEVIDYQNLLEIARIRNKIFFKKLHGEL